MSIFKKNDSNSPSLSKTLSDWKRKLAVQLSRESVGGISEGNSVQVFYDGDQAYTHMLKTIAAAEKFIHLEMYMFRSDNIGAKFAEALAERARAGVTVRIIYDAIGSLGASQMQWGRLRMAGAKVIEYRPVRFWEKHGGILGRNHRKNLIIDGEFAYTGGMNIADEWSAEYSGDKAWRDTHLWLAGPSAADFNQLFLDTWEYATGEKISNIPPAPATPHNIRCMLIGSQGIGTRSHIQNLFTYHLSLAKHSVKLTVPYFLPTRKLRRVLKDSPQKGVHISLLLPRDSDVRLADWLREGLYPKILQWKLRAYEYLGPTLHAKTLVVDDAVAVIGSQNMDPLSIKINREISVVIFDETIADDLNTQWHNDLELSEPLSQYWSRYRPWWRYLIAKICSIFIKVV